MLPGAWLLENNVCCCIGKVSTDSLAWQIKLPMMLPVLQARDAFYQCVKESGVLYSSKTPIPSKCKQLRSKFESACLQSWVGWLVPMVLSSFLHHNALVRSSQRWYKQAAH